MKNLIRFCGALLLTVFWAGTLSAQTTLDQTTLSTSITTTNGTSIVIASATCTGCTFGRDILIFVGGEAMRVTGAYVSGTTVPVRRGTDGTTGKTHASGELVWLGPANRFELNSSVGANRSGSCTRTSLTTVPVINVPGNFIWDCLNSIWAIGNAVTGETPSVVGRTLLNNTNYTVLNTDYIIAINSITGAKTITLPSALVNPGKVIIIKDELGTLSASTSITITATAGSVDAVTSVTMSTPFSTFRYYSNGTAWFGW